jgi:serine/threonine-protein kinase
MLTSDAFNLLLKGRYHFYKLKPSSLAKSKEYFEQAIALDEDYALAWCRLARYYNVSGYLGFLPPRKAHEQAYRAAEKALKLDENLAEAHGVLGILKEREYAWKESELAFLRSLELDPRSDDILQNYSIFLLWPTARLDQALATSQKALKLDPLSPFHHVIVGDCFYFAGEYVSAINHSILR